MGSPSWIAKVTKNRMDILQAPHSKYTVWHYPLGLQGSLPALHDLESARSGHTAVPASGVFFPRGEHVAWVHSLADSLVLAPMDSLCAYVFEKNVAVRSINVNFACSYQWSRHR